MSTAIAKIKTALKYVRGFFPEALPVGMTAFNTFIDDLIATYSLPTTLRDDVIYVVASTILRLKETGAYKSRFYFVLVIRSAGAKQIAGAAFQDIKARQQAAIEAAKATNDAAQA